MKKIYIFIVLCLFEIIVSSANKHRLRNRKFDLSFSTDSFISSNEKPKLMESILDAKSTKVSASYSTVGEEKKLVEDLAKDQRFKENNKNVNKAPTIVKSLGFPQRFNVEERVAQQLDQTISNKQAYDVIYPTHQDYYKDKKFIVFDRNFNKAEDYLLNQFKSAIDSAIDYSGNSKLERVEDFDRSKVNLKGMNLQNNAPYIHRDVVSTSIKYDEIKKNDPNVKIMSSDPYNTIFNGRTN